MSANHTPVPWAELADGHIGVYGTGKRGNVVLAEVCSGNLADKGFIVRAVNSHDALLDALRSVRNEYRSYVLSDPKNLEDAKGSRILAQIDNAIAAAEARP